MSLSRRSLFTLAGTGLVAGAGAVVVGAVASGNVTLPGMGADGAPPVPPAPNGGQSPIDVRPDSTRVDHSLAALEVYYPTSVDLTLRFAAHGEGVHTCAKPGAEDTFQASVPAGAAWITLGDRRYDLVQFHFHTPSEHLLNGSRSPVEQHFVHKGPDGETLVIGMFLVRGGTGSSPVVDRALASIAETCASGTKLPGVNLAEAVQGNLSTVRYTGSLTTAPFTEPVLWLVCTSPRKVPARVVDRFATAFPGGNARAPQAVGDRSVLLRPQV